MAVNNGAGPVRLELPARLDCYRAVLSGALLRAEAGRLSLELGANGAELLVPEQAAAPERSPIPAPEQWRAALDRALQARQNEQAVPAVTAIPAAPPAGKAVDEMSVPELQALILQKLAANGPVTERMRREVAENVYLNSLRNWARSFR